MRRAKPGNDAEERGESAANAARRRREGESKKCSHARGMYQADSLVPADRVKSKENDLVEPLPVDPGDSRAGDAERVRGRERLVIGDPATGGQMPEIVVAVNGDDGDGKDSEKEEDDRPGPESRMLLDHLQGV